MNINVFNQASIKLTSTIVIYCDPYKLPIEEHDASYIFITHDHYDHYDEESLKKAMNETTTLIVPTCLEEKAKHLTSNLIVVRPNQHYRLINLEFDTIPAYNIDKPYHPITSAYVGYNITYAGKRYYIMGDTDITTESKQVKTDICFVPIGGTYTMDVTEAINYINFTKPELAIPIHYGSIVGDINLKDEFIKEIKPPTKVQIYIK